MENVSGVGSKETSSKSPEMTAEQISPDDIREKITTSIKDKTDKEGGMLFEAYKNSVGDSERFPVIAETYKQAKESYDNLDQEGEVNKLIASLNALYKQAGIREGYKPEIKYEGDLSDKNRQQLINERVTADFNSYPELYAESKIDSYVEARLKLFTAEDKTTRVVDEDLFKRVDVRRALYEVQQARTGLLNVVEEEGKKVKNDEFARKMAEGIEKDWAFEEKQSEKKFSDLEKDEQSRLISESAESYKDGYEDLKYQGHRNTVDNLTVDERRDVFGKIAEINRKIKISKDTLRRAVRNSPQEASNLASEIRSLQVEKEIELSHASVSIAEERTASLRETWSKSKDDFLRKLQKGGTRYLKQEVLDKFTGSLNEWAESKGEELGRKVGGRATELFAKIDEKIDKIEDKFEGVLDEVDEIVFSRVRSVAEKTKEKLRKYKEKLKDNKAKIEADVARRKVISQKKSYQARHATENWFREKGTKLFVKSREFKWETWSSLGYLGGEKVREETKERMDRISKVSEKDFERRVKRIKESQNPYMEVFKKDLEKRIKFVKTAAEQEIAAASKEKMLVEEQLFENVSRARNETREIRDKVAKGEADQNDFGEKIRLWMEQIEFYNGYMEAIIKDRGLDSEDNEDYQKFEEVGDEIAELYSRLKQEEDREERFKLVGRYHNLVVNAKGSRWSSFNKLRPKY